MNTLDLIELVKPLNRAKLSAAPCPWLPAISLFVDEYYENFDYDIIGPKARLRSAKILQEHGFRQRSGRVLEGPAGRIEFPKPTRSLASDPARELEDVLDRDVLAFATPTQVVLVTWRREGPEPSPERVDALVDLVYEQPANLDKVRDWLRLPDYAAAFARIRPRLEESQKEGFELRRRGRFRSRLPK